METKFTFPNVSLSFPFICCQLPITRTPFNSILFKFSLKVPARRELTVVCPLKHKDVLISLISLRPSAKSVTFLKNRLSTKCLMGQQISLIKNQCEFVRRLDEKLQFDSYEVVRIKRSFLPLLTCSGLSCNSASTFYFTLVAATNCRTLISINLHEIASKAFLNSFPIRAQAI